MTRGVAGIVVMAKAPVAGCVKTRLCPPCTPEQAAALAEAALADTLAAVSASPAPWTAVALDGPPGPWLPRGVGIVSQRGTGLGERLAAAVVDAPARFGPPEGVLVIGGDTPQATAEVLSRSLARLAEPGVDAVLGPSPDGGYWAIGLRRPDPLVFASVPMSVPSTSAEQLRRLHELELRVALLPSCRDVDTAADAVAVAAEAPGSRFAAAWAAAGIAVPARP